MNRHTAPSKRPKPSLLMALLMRIGLLLQAWIGGLSRSARDGSRTVPVAPANSRVRRAAAARPATPRHPQAGCLVAGSRAYTITKHVARLSQRAGVTCEQVRFVLAHGARKWRKGGVKCHFVTRQHALHALDRASEQLAESCRGLSLLVDPGTGRVITIERMR